MTDDLKIIRQLEEKIDSELKQQKLNAIIDNKGYAVDKKGNVIGLNLFNTKFSAISILKELMNLSMLSLGSNHLQDISALKDLTNLTDLYLSDNQISDISAIKKLTKLNTLHLASNQLSDISTLKDLTNLTKLDLSENKISDISALKKLPNLTHIYMKSNQLSDISILKDLANLTELRLDKNKISEVSALKDLNNLSNLDLSENKISDISALKELTNLKRLDLRDNHISHFSRAFVDLNMEIKWEIDSKGGIILEGNPLKSPPFEIVKKGKDAISAYFKSLERTPISKTYTKENSPTGDEELKLVIKKIDKLRQQLTQGKNLKIECDKLAKKKTTKSLLPYVFIILGIVVFWVALIFHYGWDKMEIWTYVLAIFIGTSTIIYALLGGKFNLKEIRNRREKKEKQKQYALHKFSLETHENLKKELEEAEKKKRSLIN